MYQSGVMIQYDCIRGNKQIDGYVDKSNSNTKGVILRIVHRIT